MNLRYPPSPTGPMHIGTARTLLFNFLVAKRHGAGLVFRLEDTDRTRSDESFTEDISAGLSFLGIEADNKTPIRQSERNAIYEAAFRALKEKGAVYPAYETPEELEELARVRAEKKMPPGYFGAHRNLSAEEKAHFEKEGRKPLWRFRVPEGALSFTDAIHGTITQPAGTLADFAIRKADGQFLYHFCVCVDDAEMNITHVIRGDDHISNTFKHLLLFNALGSPAPTFAHVPLLLNADRSKMSKRDHSGKPLTISRLKEDGFLPEAIINYMALLGWHPKDERELFSLAELTQAFSLEACQKAGAVFDLTKLIRMNQIYIRKLSVGECLQKAAPFLQEAQLPASGPTAEKAMGLVQEKLQYFSEAPELLRVFFVRPEPNTELLANEKMKVSHKEALGHVRAARQVLSSLEEWNIDSITAAIMADIQSRQCKNGQYLWPLRVALTASPASPGAFEMAEALGREEALTRVDAALLAAE